MTEHFFPVTRRSPMVTRTAVLVVLEGPTRWCGVRREGVRVTEEGGGCPIRVTVLPGNLLWCVAYPRSCLSVQKGAARPCGGAGGWNKKGAWTRGVSG